MWQHQTLRHHRYIERVRTIPNGMTEAIPANMTVRRKLVGVLIPY
jgi:hypothetical protein